MNGIEVNITPRRRIYHSGTPQTAFTSFKLHMSKPNFYLRQISIPHFPKNPPQILARSTEYPDLLQELKNLASSSDRWK